MYLSKTPLKMQKCQNNLWNKVWYNTTISDCGQPSDLTLSSKNVPCTTYGCTTTYTCDTGYNVDPPGTSPTINCGASTWDTRTFTCEPNGKQSIKYDGKEYAAIEIIMAYLTPLPYRIKAVRIFLWFKLYSYRETLCLKIEFRSQMEFSLLYVITY